MKGLSKIKPQSRTDMVTEKLTDLILSGELSDGDLLPPEPKLCEIFGVSRNILREAVKILASKGLVEVKQGHGTRVRIPKDEVTEEALETYLKTNPISLLQLMEIRTPLEIETARLTAQRRKPEHLVMMERALHVMQTQAEDLEAVVKADDEFHQAMIEATGNPMFKIIIRPLLAYLHVSRQLTIGHFGLKIVLQQHREAYEAIKARDVKRATKCMKAQMALTLKHLQTIEDEQLHNQEDTP
jgi:DNA-binding FadR family transcriptional regulator